MDTKHVQGGLLGSQVCQPVSSSTSSKTQVGASGPSGLLSCQAPSLGTEARLGRLEAAIGKILDALQECRDDAASSDEEEAADGGKELEEVLRSASKASDKSTDNTSKHMDVHGSGPDDGRGKHPVDQLPRSTQLLGGFERDPNRFHTNRCQQNGPVLRQWLGSGFHVPQSVQPSR